MSDLKQIIPDLRDGERIDDLQRGGFRLIQRPDSFCLGTDSVLLADFASPRPKEKAADLGCGNGALGILLAARRNDIDIDAVEIREESAELARRNVRLNDLENRFRVHTADLRTAPDMLGKGMKSLVICNPPYWEKERSVVNAGSNQIKARFQEEASPQEVCRAAAALLKFGGRFCTVFPAQRAFEMMTAMQSQRLEPKRLRTVHADPGRAPKIVLIEAVKGGGTGLMWMPPLILKNADGSPSDEWKRIYGK